MKLTKSDILKKALIEAMTKSLGIVNKPLLDEAKRN